MQKFDNNVLKLKEIIIKKILILKSRQYDALEWKNTRIKLQIFRPALGSYYQILVF